MAGSDGITHWAFKAIIEATPSKTTLIEIDECADVICKELGIGLDFEKRLRARQVAKKLIERGQPLPLSKKDIELLYNQG